MRTPLLLIAIATSYVAASASVLTPEAAFKRVKTESEPSGIRTLSVADTPRLAFTQATTQGEAAVYVFTSTSGPGTYVVSADSEVTPLLGYSDNTFDSDNMSPSLRYWLDEYARQIEYVRANNIQQKAVSRATRAAIAPMTATRWNQSSPYNDDCPTYNGSKCVTGCVATAMAQVMKYHNYPPKGTGTKTYTATTINQSLTVDYANITYDWDDMLDVYGSDATDAQKAAVANLMYSCGVAVNMDYTPNESGASSMSIPTAMIEYFGYDKGLRYVPRDYYGLEEWENLVYDNLSYGPIQYSGQNDEGGHSFVCDGYSSDGYFHINWGWGGMSDGYFLLTALDPTEQGIGGSTSGYNYGQDVVVGVQKPVEGSTIYEQLYAQNFTINTSSAALGGRVSVYGPVYSYSAGPISGTLGLKITSSDGTVTYATGAAFSNLKMGYGYSSYNIVLPSTLAEGEYTVTPAFRTSTGEWRDIPVALTAEQTADMTVSGSTAYFTNNAAPQLTVTNVDYATPFYIGNKYKVTATVTNSGDSEYYGTILLGLAKSTTSTGLSAVGPDLAIDLQPGESTDITYIGEFTSSQVSAGTYYVAFFTGDYEELTDLHQITIQEAGTLAMTVTTPEIENSTSVDPDDFTATTDVTVTSGYLGGPLTLAIFPYTTTGGSVSDVCTLSSDNIFMDSTSGTKTVTFSGKLSNVTPGKEYFAAVYGSNNSMVSRSYSYFTIKAESAIDDITTADGVDTYINISGTTMPESNLVPGVYIKRTVNADGTVKVSKTLIR